MTKKQLTQLVTTSYTNIALDEKKVSKIGSLLTRSNLKMYINALKQEENRRNIFVSVPKSTNITELENEFKNMYPGKKIVISIDPELILGLQIKNNDLVYEENLKETLENMLEYLKQ